MFLTGNVPVPIPPQVMDLEIIKFKEIDGSLVCGECVLNSDYYRECNYIIDCTNERFTWQYSRRIDEKNNN